MPDNKCEYCGSLQNRKYDLKRHQQTSKNCILIQQSRGIQVDVPTKCCELCGGSFAVRYLKEHIKNCSSRAIPINNSFNSHIDNSVHDNSVHDNSIHDNSVNTTNITNNITLDFGKFFTDEKIAQIFQEYKSEHALEQMKGLAKFVIEKILLLDDTPGYYVRDAMRNIYAYDTDDGIKTDKNGEELRAKIKSGAGDHIKGIVETLVYQFSVQAGKKNEQKVEDMKAFKKDINELNTTSKFINKIKKDYTCKNKEERAERISRIKIDKEKEEAKKLEMVRAKKTEAERQRKIKLYKFNLDKDRQGVVLSKNQNEPLEYSDKPKLEELGLKAGDMFLEDILA
jgi:hypothetical protein